MTLAWLLPQLEVDDDLGRDPRNSAGLRQQATSLYIVDPSDDVVSKSTSPWVSQGETAETGRIKRRRTVSQSTTVTHTHYYEKSYFNSMVAYDKKLRNYIESGAK